MLRSKKLPQKNLQMQKLMLPKAKANLRNEATLLLQKESTTWITICASIVANLDIKPLNAKPHQINGWVPSFTK
jgi:hypothetical protein